MDERARALEDLYRRKHGAFWNVVAAMTRDRDVAEEVVQEAFARALSKRRQLKDLDALEPWVWRIALRVAWERAEPLTLRLEEIPESAALPEPEKDPDLNAALRSLAPKRRLIVFLRYFAGLSYAEIAIATDVTDGTVAATLSQAQAELNARLTRMEVTYERPVG